MKSGLISIAIVGMNSKLPESHHLWLTCIIQYFSRYGFALSITAWSGYRSNASHFSCWDHQTYQTAMSLSFNAFAAAFGLFGSNGTQCLFAILSIVFAWSL